MNIYVRSVLFQPLQKSAISIDLDDFHIGISKFLRAERIAFIAQERDVVFGHHICQSQIPIDMTKTELFVTIGAEHHPLATEHRFARHPVLPGIDIGCFLGSDIVDRDILTNTIVWAHAFPAGSQKRTRLQIVRRQLLAIEALFVRRHNFAVFLSPTQMWRIDDAYHGVVSGRHEIGHSGVQGLVSKKRRCRLECYHSIETQPPMLFGTISCVEDNGIEGDGIAGKHGIAIDNENIVVLPGKCQDLF